ncbi:hypothetical protein [Kaistia sp. MMO-174]|uniref:hypothetical protein n=1 Tax=Kaistia sp. MMO-174 TaxID=3081256 RepID=UPI0030167758
MGITSLALQYLTVAALRGATLAGEAVQPGAIDALDVDLARMAKPVITVFIGQDDREITGKDLRGGEHSVELLIQTFLPAEIEISVEGSPLRLSSRDGGSDLITGMLWRQIERALMSSDSDAATLWRILVASVKTANATPFLFQITDQVRVAACETSYLVNILLDEPSFGQSSLDDFWRAVVGLFSEDPDYAPIAAWIEAEIKAPNGLARWRIDQADLGLSAEARAGIGIGPVDAPGGSEAVPPYPNAADPASISGATVEVEGQGEWVIDSDSPGMGGSP